MNKKNDHNDSKSDNKNKNNHDAIDSKETKDFSLTDTFKKVLTAGSAAELSKEILGNVVGQVVKTKDDITLKATQEMISLIQKIDFVKEFSKFAQNHKFKITAEIEVLKKDSEESNKSDILIKNTTTSNKN